MAILEEMKKIIIVAYKTEYENLLIKQMNSERNHIMLFYLYFHG